MIHQLHDHFIVCGFGRVGRNAPLEFQRTGAPFLVVDRNDQRVEKAMHAGMLGVVADATQDDSLREAGVLQARGLIAPLPSDAENLFIILSPAQACGGTRRRQTGYVLGPASVPNTAIAAVSMLERESDEYVIEKMVELECSPHYAAAIDQWCEDADRETPGIETKNLAMLQLHARIFVAGVIAARESGEGAA